MEYGLRLITQHATRNTQHATRNTQHATRNTEQTMAVLAVLGCQWGDEGKGKIVDMLAAEARVVVRANGGANAGHTIVNPAGTFKLHLIPSGIFHPRAICVI